MDFDLSPEQETLGEAAGELLSELCRPEQVRLAGGFDTRLWGAMVEQGWLGVAAGDGVGGLGLGTVEVVVLLERAGGALAPVPLQPQLLAVDALSGTRWAEDLLAGEVLGTGARGPVARNRDGTVSGRPEPVKYGGRASVLVVPAMSAASAGMGSAARSAGTARTESAARTAGTESATGTAGTESVAGTARTAGTELAAGSAGTELVAVDLTGSGVSRTTAVAMDSTRELAWVELDSAPAITVGGEAEVDRHLERGAVYCSAEILGAARTAMNLAVDYAGRRHQFGRPIGSFQAIKHRCADMLVDVEQMHSAVYHAAWTMDTDHPDAPVAAAVAKTWCSDAGLRVAESALHVYGGIGFTWECDVHLYLKRIQLDRTSFGDATWHRTRLAQLLHTRLAAGQSII